MSKRLTEAYSASSSAKSRSHYVHDERLSPRLELNQDIPPHREDKAFLSPASEVPVKEQWRPCECVGCR